MAPHVRIVGAQSVNTAAMSRSLAAGRLVEIENLPTLADGLAGQIDDDAFDIGRHAIDDMVTLDRGRDREGDRLALARRTASASRAPARVPPAQCWSASFTSIKTPAAIVVSGGNIDDAKLEAARRHA